MRIENLRRLNQAGFARVSADVIWEESSRQSREIYFEVGDEFASELSLDPNAFLLACAIPAWAHGEARVSIQSEVDPGLLSRLPTAIAWLRYWYGGNATPKFEAKVQESAAFTPPAPRVASFLSGGIDSLATLRLNRLNFPRTHPGSVSDGLLVYGFDVGYSETVDAKPALFAHAVQSIRAVAQDADVRLVPVYTNLRYLEDDSNFWAQKLHGAGLAAVAHALSHNLTDVLIASTNDISNLEPWGSSPMLDPNYGSTDLRVHHDGVALTRLDKTKIVAQWDAALQNLRVCSKTDRLAADELNCGRCDKCLRTMTALLTLGVLDKTRAFERSDLEPALYEPIELSTPYAAGCYEELVQPLRAVGRDDLANGVEALLAKWRRFYEWKTEKDWKGLFKQYDRRYLRGIMHRVFKNNS